MKCAVAAGGRWNLKDRASGVLVADKQTEGESGEERMGSARDERCGNPSVLTEHEDRRGGRRVREREREQ